MYFIFIFHLSSPSLSRFVNRLERVSFLEVLNLLNYMSNESESTPVIEALLQLKNIYRLLEKRQELDLVARMKVLYIHIHSSNTSIIFTMKCSRLYRFDQIKIDLIK